VTSGGQTAAGWLVAGADSQLAIIGCVVVDLDAASFRHGWQTAIWPT
jgi:hypothetical protein